MKTVYYVCYRDSDDYQRYDCCFSNRALAEQHAKRAALAEGSRGLDFYVVEKVVTDLFEPA